MKLFNPWKPHIVQFRNGTYGIRRRSCGCWEYMDVSGLKWWSVLEYVHKYCEMSVRDVFTNMDNADCLKHTKKDKGRVVFVKQFDFGTSIFYILCCGLATAAIVLIAWPIFNWLFRAIGL